jgi:5-methyltetrahydrofolate--homocysteine methyltransferase
MILIAELINASRPRIREAIAARDAALIRRMAADQDGAGADYIDVNAGTLVGREPECLRWLVETVQQATERPCAIDSPDPEAIAAALSVHRGTAMINSISLEKERWQKLLPVIAGAGVRVIALCTSDAGMPETVDERLKIADALVNGLVRSRIALENIFVDPLVQPVALNTASAMAALDAIERIMAAYPGIHTACGMSNISFGLPARKILNRTFLTMAIARGLDAAIVNVLDRSLMAAVIAAEALAGRDDYCMNYIQAFETGRLD